MLGFGGHCPDKGGGKSGWVRSQQHSWARPQKSTKTMSPREGEAGGFPGTYEVATIVYAPGHGSASCIGRFRGPSPGRTGHPLPTERVRTSFSRREKVPRSGG